MWNGRHDTKFRHDIMKSGFLLSIVYTVAIAGTFQGCCFGILISKPNKLVTSPRRASYHTLVCHWSLLRYISPAKEFLHRKQRWGFLRLTGQPVLPSVSPRFSKRAYLKKQTKWNKAKRDRGGRRFGRWALVCTCMNIYLHTCTHTHTHTCTRATYLHTRTQTHRVFHIHSPLVIHFTASWYKHHEMDSNLPAHVCLFRP